MIITITTEAANQKELTSNLIEIIRAVNSNNQDVYELMDGSYQIGTSNLELELANKKPDFEITR